MSRSDQPRSSSLSPYAPLPDGLREAVERLARELRFPIESKRGFAEQLGGVGGTFRVIGDRDVSIDKWLGFVPAALFPIASAENFVEKISDLYLPPGGRR